MRGGVERGAMELRVVDLVGDFLHAVDQAHFVEGVDERRQAAVNAEHSAVDNRGDVHAVEHVAARFPN